MSEKEKHSVLSVRLPIEIDERLTKAAERLDLSKNDIARHAIRAAVQAIEENGFRIEVPLQMQIAKPGKPIESKVEPKGAFAAIARAGRDRISPLTAHSEEAPILNESPDPAPAPRTTKARAALRAMARKENPK